MLDFLKGKKSYIVAGAIGVLGIAVQLGYLDQGTANQILIYLAAALGAALRAGIGKGPNS